VTVKKLFGLIKKKDVYLAESFFKSKDFECIYHFNPDFNLYGPIAYHKQPAQSKALHARNG